MDRGRPTIYSKELGEEICRRISQGESLRAICKDEGMPDESTVRHWATDDRDGFYPQYSRARDIALDLMAEEVIAIADDSSEDYVTRVNEKGDEYTTIDHDHIQRSRLRFDARRWYLSKLAPKKYGDQTKLSLEGGDKPIEIKVSTVRGDMRKSPES